MRPIGSEQLNEVLSRAAVRVADKTLGIGRELSYREPPRRTVVVHFAETEPLDYLRSVASGILELREEWLLVPRHGSVSDLGLLAAGMDTAAISFAANERHELAEYLCTRPVDIISASSDLYVLEARGDVLVTWDHHTADEGLQVSLQSVPEATRLLASLNDLGVELELFYLAP